MPLHHRFNCSSLVALLGQWAEGEGERAPQQDVAQQLSQWLSAVDAIQFSRALHAMESVPSDGGQQGAAVDAQAMAAAFQVAKAQVMELFTATMAPAKPMRGRADLTPVDGPDPLAQADFAGHAQRYLGLQKQMCAKLAALRAQMRQWLAKGSPALRKLAALDAVMEQMLEAREQRLWAALPAYLERRMAQLQREHLLALQSCGLTDEPLRWRQHGGWLWRFERDLQALLLAQMQVLLQPITGLLEAAHNEKTGQQE